MEPTVGARIRAFREQAGVQAQDLAALVGIDPSAMSNIERDKRNVKTQELTRIAEVLHVSPLALLGEPSLPARLPVAPRHDGGPIIKGPAYDRLLALAELHTVLADAGLPSENHLDQAPQFDQPGWRATAERAAKWATGYLGVDTTGDERFAALADAIEDRLGVDVLVEQHQDDSLSGAAITDREFPLIFVNGQYPTPRCLFTLAHEFGHLLLGHEGSITLDQDLNGDNQEERQANAFAAAFLMPRDDVYAHIKDYGRGAECLARMVYDFGVSFESLVYRLQGLRIVSGEGRDQLRAAGWRGLLGTLQSAELQKNLDPEVIAHLMSRLSRRPNYRPPLLLARRCLLGHRKGAVSIRPLAGLFDVDSELLLDQIEGLNDDTAAALESPYPPDEGEIEDDDYLFAGSPVS